MTVTENPSKAKGEPAADVRAEEISATFYRPARSFSFTQSEAWNGSNGKKGRACMTAREFVLSMFLLAGAAKVSMSRAPIEGKFCRAMDKDGNRVKAPEAQYSGSVQALILVEISDPTLDPTT
jgi:hypothetical protein